MTQTDSHWILTQARAAKRAGTPGSPLINYPGSAQAQIRQLVADGKAEIVSVTKPSRPTGEMRTIDYLVAS